MGQDPSTWNVIFIAREKIYWWDWIFCWGRFKHVVAIGYNPVCDQWMYYDWSYLGAVVLPIEKRVLDALILHTEDNGGVVMEAPEPDEDYRGAFLPLATCVSAIKHLNRIKSWAQTPDQLFCAYQERGAKRLFVTIDSDVEVPEAS